MAPIVEKVYRLKVPNKLVRDSEDELWDMASSPPLSLLKLSILPQTAPRSMPAILEDPPPPSWIPSEPSYPTLC